MAISNLVERTIDIDAGIMHEDLRRLFAVADAQAHTFRIAVTSKGIPQDLSGHTVVGYFMTNYHGTVVITGSVSGNTATLVLPATCYAYNTGFQLIIRLVSGSTKTAIYWGSGYVTRSATSPQIDPGNVVPDLDDLLARLDQMDQATQAANNAATNANTAAEKSAQYEMGSNKILPSNADFNNYTTHGVYTLASNRQYVNSPVEGGNVSGVLEVYVFTPSNLIMQFVKSVNGIMYSRYKAGGNAWSAWYKTFDDNSVRYVQQSKTDGQKAVALDNIGAYGYGGNVKYITAGTDFDTITNTGVYQVYSSSVTPNINAPVNSSGMLIVTNGDYSTYDDYYVTQCFIPSNGHLYFRQIINRPNQQNTWSGWLHRRLFSLRILFIGNSLTQDGIAYLPYLLKDYPDIDFRLYMWYVGGYTLEQHYAKFIEDSACTIFSGTINQPSWSNTNNSVKMSEVLSSYQFDIVCMQPYLSYRSVESELTAWNNCVSYIKDHYTGGNSLKFIAMFHAPKRDRVEDDVSKCKTMMHRLLSETICEDIIPMGLAVYDALSTDLDSLGDQGHLSPDGTHTQEGLPCLLQTYVALQWCFDKLSIPKSVYNHKLRMTTEIYNSINVPGPNLGTGVITGTDAQNVLAQEVAIQAYKEGKELLAQLSNYVRFDIVQNKTEEQKARARENIGAISNTAKNALLDCFRHVAWIDTQGQTLYNALVSALGIDDFTVINNEAIARVGVVETNGYGAKPNENQTARCRLRVPLKNNNNTYSVIDSTKYNLALYPLLNNTMIERHTSYADPTITNMVYDMDGSAIPSWGVSATSNANYVWISFRKLDGTDFTSAEIENAYGTIYTIS